MSDYGVTRERLIELYMIRGLSQEKVGIELGVCTDVARRWIKENGISTKKKSVYSFNNKFFDTIDSESKAYWLGFIWCDGYLHKRYRNEKNTETPLKVSVASHDIDILEKLKVAVDSNHPIKYYDTSKSSFKGSNNEVRLTLNNSYFGLNLHDKYGMFPHRCCVKKLRENVPVELIQHFIRGVFDADGSLTVYNLKSGKNKGSLKSTLSFSTYPQMTDWIQDVLIDEGLKDNRVKTYKRHKNSNDENNVDLRYSGVTQVYSILSYLYKDATVFLNRKHDRFKELENIMKKTGRLD